MFICEKANKIFQNMKDTVAPDKFQSGVIDKMNRVFGQNVHRMKKARKHTHLCCLKDCVFLVWFRTDPDGKLTFKKVISQHHSVLAHSNSSAKKKLLFD
jgi:hypothetical protein